MEKSSLRILVLDDEPLMLELLAGMLADLGYHRVTTCTSGYRALSLVDSPGSDAGVDLILSDLNMPEMDGLQFIRHLGGKGYAGGLLLMSGVDERIVQSTERLVRSYGIAMVGYLCKPFTPQDLETMLQNWCPGAPEQTAVARTDYSASEIRAAIAAKELLNYYQPKVSLATGELVGAEVLVRWEHPVDGLLMPSQFLGEAQAHDIIEDLTQLVLKHALDQHRAWREAGLTLDVAVNVSMDWLGDLAFPDFVAGLAAQANVAPRHLVLEVTESRLMHDLRAGLEILTRLRLMGFGLSINVFGTGSSSLAQLRDLPFTELKIARAPAAGSAENLNGQAMYLSSLTMGQQLGVAVVAEGVESLADWEFIRDTGCDIAQGYFIGEPMPAEKVVDWLGTWRERSREASLPRGTAATGSHQSGS